MNFEEFWEQFLEHMPAGWAHEEKVDRYIKEVEYNSTHIPFAIYKPKQEIRTFLTEIAREEDDWMPEVLELLTDA